MADSADHSLERLPAGWSSSWKIVDPEDSAATFSVGDLLSDRYRIEAVLGRGGMGLVYRATDLELGVPVALKTIRPEIASDPRSLRRFKQEVLLSRSISHPNVCRIYDIGRDPARGITFLTMEFLEGESIAQRLQKIGAFTPEETLPIVRELTDALDAAHRAGVVHRDLKSSNVMLVRDGTSDRAVITDFGLAIAPHVHSEAGSPPRALPSDDDAQRTRERRDPPSDSTSTVLAPSVEYTEYTGPSRSDGSSSVSGLIGTPEYMAPEQVLGTSVGAASDLYALGIVIYEMTTGRLPFREATRMKTALRRLETEPVPPSRICGAISGPWERAILRLLEREPSQRYRSGREVVQELEGKALDLERAGHALPAERDTFVGRERERAVLLKALHAASGHELVGRFVTIQGPGGAGKTRLAQRFGWEVLARWPGGIWFCDLSDANTIDGLVAAVAKGLDVPLGNDPVAQLGHAIAGRGRSLVILDNFEQLVDYAPATLGIWLGQCRETSFLVTSRERLGLEGESVLSLEPLDPAGNGAELFELRAQVHRPGFRVDDTNRTLVHGVVARLDGLPLAIELAAARLRVLSLDQLASRLDDRFGTLAGGTRGRHATLQTTLDWSWDLLSPWEQTALAQASVFEGGFKLEAAEAVIDVGVYREAPSVLDVIQSLIDKSLVRAKVVGGAPRFEMYESVRDYASGKLADHVAGTAVGEAGSSEAAAGAEIRHAEYFSHYGADARGEIRWAIKREPRSFIPDLDNYIVACRRSLDRDQPDLAARCLGYAWSLLTLRGPYSIGVALATRVIEAGPLRLRAEVLHVLGQACRVSSQIEAAERHYDEALGEFQKVGDQIGEAYVLCSLGIHHDNLGHPEVARDLYERAIALAQRIDLPDAQSLALDHLACQQRDQGEFDTARRNFQTALQLNNDMGNRRGEAIVRGHLGALTADSGHVHEALPLFEQALAIYQDIGDRVGEAITLNNIALTHSLEGRSEAAAGAYGRALKIHREVGNRRSEGITLGNLASVRLDQGDLDQAREAVLEALRVHRIVGNRRFEGIHLDSLATIYRRAGDAEEARAAHEQALRIHRELNNRLFVANALQGLAEIAMEAGDLNEAAAHLESLSAVTSELGQVRFQATLEARTAELRALQGRVSEAALGFDRALSLARDVHDDRFLIGILCRRGVFQANQGGISQAGEALREANALATDLGAESGSSIDDEIQRLRALLSPGI